MEMEKIEKLSFIYVNHNKSADLFLHLANVCFFVFVVKHLLTSYIYISTSTIHYQTYCLLLTFLFNISFLTHLDFNILSCKAFGSHLFFCWRFYIFALFSFCKWTFHENSYCCMTQKAVKINVFLTPNVRKIILSKGGKFENQKRNRTCSGRIWNQKEFCCSFNFKIIWVFFYVCAPFTLHNWFDSSTPLPASPLL